MSGRGVVVALGLAVLGCGCGTVHNVRRPTLPPAESPGAEVCRVYGGVRGDWDAATDYPWRTTPTWVDYVVLPALATVELGLTALGDTVTLPYTVVAEVRRALAGPGATQPPVPVPVVADPGAGPKPVAVVPGPEQ